ncbi:MAG: hypothetical protein HY656_03995 [Acidobacteria bacterium]|nr:hypothetical protein [Acidobacteriota bacterium]
MRKLLTFTVLLSFLQPLVLTAAVRGKEVMYVGGTITTVPEATEGLLDYQDENVLRFTSPKGSFEIPYDRVTSLEYGQKAGRRLGVALAITIWALFSKKRKHFMTIGYNDENDKPQGVVLELPKGMPRTVIAVIEARSGVKCDYESEEARKHVHG